MDPFDQFGQEEISWSMLEEHGPRLASEAAATLQQFPGGELHELAGLIALPDTREWTEIRKIATQMAPEFAQLRGPFLGVVPRGLLAALGGAAFASFADEHAAPFSSMLPVAVTTKGGLRFAAFKVQPLEPES